MGEEIHFMGEPTGAYKRIDTVNRIVHKSVFTGIATNDLNEVAYLRKSLEQ